MSSHAGRGHTPGHGSSPRQENGAKWPLLPSAPKIEIKAESFDPHLLRLGQCKLPPGHVCGVIEIEGLPITEARRDAFDVDCKDARRRSSAFEIIQVDVELADTRRLGNHPPGFPG